MNEDTDNAMGRTPDLETESFRAWKATDKEKKELEKDIKEHGFKIKYKDMEFTMLGFTYFFDKKDVKNKKVLFAHKFKHDKKEYLYYIDKDCPKERRENIEMMFKLIEMKGYDMQDMMEYSKNIYNERKTIDKIGKGVKNK